MTTLTKEMFEEAYDQIKKINSVPRILRAYTPENRGLELRDKLEYFGLYDPLLIIEESKLIQPGYWVLITTEGVVLLTDES